MHGCIFLLDTFLVMDALYPFLVQSAISFYVEYIKLGIFTKQQQQQQQQQQRQQQQKDALYIYFWCSLKSVST